MCIRDSGTILSTWDHGAKRSTARDHTGANLNLPNIPPSNDWQGYAPLGARPWAVRVHGAFSNLAPGRLYYSIWSMDTLHTGSPSAFPNQIWSIGLTSGGAF